MKKWKLLLAPKKMKMKVKPNKKISNNEPLERRTEFLCNNIKKWRSETISLTEGPKKPVKNKKEKSYEKKDKNDRKEKEWWNLWKKGKLLRVLLSGRWLPGNQGWLNFWETRLVIVRKSLHRSCWTELTCQGILLP